MGNVLVFDVPEDCEYGRALRKQMDRVKRTTMNDKTALVTGITGQSASYLAEHLLNLGYHVHGIIRRSSSFNTGRIEHIRERLTLHYGDMTDAARLRNIIADVRPSEVYNLAAQSHVAVSFLMPDYTKQTIFEGTAYLLDAIWCEKLTDCRIYQASSSEMFGNSGAPQNETTPFDPQSPYARAKLAAHEHCHRWRNRLKIWCGILFNHESPRRGETFVTRKITRAVGRIKYGLQDKLKLGNLDAIRDWSHADRLIRWAHTMLQTSEPGDYVLGSGKAYSVREFAEKAFAEVGMDWRKFVEIDPRYFRPAEVNNLRADPSKAVRELGFDPDAVGDIDALVSRMVESDLEMARKERILVNAGFCDAA